VLVTQSVRAGAGEIDGVEFLSKGEHRMRNVPSPVPVFGGVREQAAGEEHHLDPVCRMLVAEGREAGTCRHRDRLYRFCSLECAEQFLRDPDAYAV
jgi:YHS domain-containing protein